MAAITRERFDRGNETPLHLADGDQTGADRFAVDLDHAGATIAGAAAIFGAGEIGRIAQCPEERRFRVHPVPDRSVIDGKFGHRALFVILNLFQDLLRVAYSIRDAETS